MFLHALGHFHPDTVIPNSFFQELGLETDEAWIVDRIGVRTRHTVLPLEYLRQTRNRDPRAALEAATVSNAESGQRAAELALKRAGLSASDIGMVIAGGCAPDESIPAEACRIAERLGIDGPAFDLNAACSSFGAQLHLLTGMRPERLPDYVLVVNPENTTRVVDYSDRASCVLWGDGTSAAILSARVPGPWRVTETLLGGDPSGADKVRVPRHGHFAQQGAAVQGFAVKRATEVCLELQRRYVAGGSARSRADVAFIGHQANLRMLESVGRRCEIAAGKHFSNVARRGNTGAAGAPSVMSELWGDSSLGDAVAMAVVGSGLTWAGVLLERHTQTAG